MSHKRILDYCTRWVEYLSLRGRYWADSQLIMECYIIGVIDETLIAFIVTPGLRVGVMTKCCLILRNTRIIAIRMLAINITEGMDPLVYQHLN